MSPARYLLLLAALLALAISAPAIRYAAAPALVVVLWRVVLAWPLLAAVSLARREPLPWRRAAAAGVCLAAHWVLWVLSVQLTTIASAALLICTGALWSALLSRPLLGEPVTRRQWLGLALALAGVAVLVWGSHGQGGRHTLLGDLLALLGSFGWVAYTFIGRHARREAGFWGYTTTVYLAAGVAVLALVLVRREPLLTLSPTTWGALVLLAIFPTLLGHGSLNYLLRFVGPARLSLFTLSEPVLATLLAWALFGEIPPPLATGGGIAALAGIALGGPGGARDEP